MWADRFPGIEQAIALSLAIIMVLNFLVMFFIDRVVRIPGMLAILQLSGSVLIFIQLALGAETILGGLASLRLFDRL
jgi:multiple antibiotic resistance protein